MAGKKGKSGRGKETVLLRPGLVLWLGSQRLVVDYIAGTAVDYRVWLKMPSGKVLDFRSRPPGPARKP